jgi:cytosine/adenosine deaminase-related metal-dependent hydrolase
LRTVSFGEVLAMGQRRCLLEERLAEAIDPSLQNEYLRIGVSPHSPYSIEPEGYRRCLEAAHARSLPLMTHLAETPDEAEFLSNHAGPFRELWRQLGGWDEQIPRFPDGPIRYAQMLGLLDYPAVLAHVNYCDDEELKLLAAAKASVVYCPRTHAYFGHPPHRWHEMLDLGINVAIATDSSTSSGDLNLLDDLRLFHRQAPKMSAEIVWQLATSRAALALGCPHLGSLAAGKMADIAAFPSRGSDPLAALLGSDDLPTQVWMGGKAIAAAAKRDALT